MKRYLLDTSALLTLRDNESGADQVAEIFKQAQQEKAICFGCFMSLMEVFYRVWKDENEQEGRLAYQQCLSLPIEWIHENQALLEKAAEIKAYHIVEILAEGKFQALPVTVNNELQGIVTNKDLVRMLRWEYTH